MSDPISLWYTHYEGLYVSINLGFPKDASRVLYVSLKLSKLTPRSSCIESDTPDIISNNEFAIESRSQCFTFLSSPLPLASGTFR